MTTIIPWKRQRVSEAEFERMVRPHLQAMYRLAWRLLRHREDAEDLVQDVLTHLYPRRDELAQVELLRPWLMRVLYRRFVDLQRRRGRQVPVFDGDEEGRDILETVESDLPGPMQVLDRMQDTHLLDEALEQLPEIHRQVLILHDVEGYTLQEMQEMTGAPIGTLKSRLSRARGALRQRLESMEPFSVARRVNG